ncbi:serine O-acetyltransferase [Terrisporobacter glycolicus]|nr:serine O-acetyltransferase [Terrisporobacter glycolicus]
MFKILIDEYKKMSGRKKINILKVVYSWILNNNFRVKVWIRYMLIVKLHFLKKLIQNHLERKYSILIGSNCKIGTDLKLEHFVGTVIGRDVVLGNDCTIYHQITLGQKYGKYPTIGNNVVIYPGAKVIGNVIVGNNVIIGANTVVLKDIPDNSIAVGIPAKIIPMK